MKQLYASILRFRVTFLLILCLSFSSNAQYYTITDAGFSEWLNAYYPSCMNGNQLDTTCNALVSASTIVISGNSLVNPVVSIDGIGFFDNLNELHVAHTSLTSVPDLPSNLTYLDCHSNQLLTSFSSLPSGLTYLECYSNQLTSLPSLPANLGIIKCPFNLLTTLPNLPANLTSLECYSNQLTSLPNLPTNLLYLLCGGNPMTSLPSLPTNLIVLDCKYNPLASLPSLPTSLTHLECNGCQLTSLPNLPESLLTLWCNDNQIQCFESNLPQNGGITGNPCTCVPNHTSYTDNLPLCYPNDPISNTNNCYSSINSGIVGRITADENADCNVDLADPSVPTIKMNLYDMSENFLATTYSDVWGYYYFPQNNGTYHIVLDTIGQSYATSCIADNVVTLQSMSTNNIDFSVDCNLPTDIGILGVAPSGLVFPGERHSLATYAGNTLAYFPANCLEHIGGTVTITVEGPIVYEGIPSGGINPTQINGNTFVYEIADFMSINYYSELSQYFRVNTTANAGDLIHVVTNVTVLQNEIDSLNNVREFFYQIGNSYDPNKKEVFPLFVEPAYDDYLTYTIHFQNTGTASAINIRLEDTLSNYLDVETFEFLHSSHPAIPTLQGNRLKFQFNNIQLADSTSNEPASHGFAQYRIKPISGLPVGTIIPNKASIYFDYNAPIVTNTATTTFSALSVNQVEANVPIIYPNPSSGLYHVKFNRSIEEINVFNLAGEHILKQQNLQNNDVIDLGNQPAGVYLLKMNQEDQTHYTRLVKL